MTDNAPLDQNYFDKMCFDTTGFDILRVGRKLVVNVVTSLHRGVKVVTTTHRYVTTITRRG